MCPRRELRAEGTFGSTSVSRGFSLFPIQDALLGDRHLSPPKAASLTCCSRTFFSPLSPLFHNMLPLNTTNEIDSGQFFDHFWS